MNYEPRKEFLKRIILSTITIGEFVVCPSPSQETITPEMIKSIERLIGNRDEVNLEWLKTVTQIPVTTLSKIIIQEFGMVILEGIIYSKEKAEKKLQQRQEELQNKVDKESFRKGPVKIDMMKLRENLWTAYLPERFFGQERHQFCPIWKYLEDNPESKIILRYDWIKRLETAIAKNSYKNLRIIEARSILNEIGDEFKGKAKIVFAKPFPRSSVFGENNVNWVLFIISFAEGVVRLEGLDMINVLKISTRFKSRELAYEALNEYLEMINFVVSDPSLFEEVIIIN